jgi:hypothetical protein
MTVRRNCTAEPQASANSPGEPRKQVTRGGFNNKRDALTALAKLQTQAHEGTYVERRTVALGEYLDAWGVP